MTNGRTYILLFIIIIRRDHLERGGSSAGLFLSKSTVKRRGMQKDKDALPSSES